MRDEKKMRTEDMDGMGSFLVFGIDMHWAESKVFVELHSLRGGYIESERLGLESTHTKQRYSCKYEFFYR